MSAVLQAPHVQIRPMRKGDLEAVFANEQAAYTHPWTMGILRDCLRVGYQCLVALVEGQMAGHAVLSVVLGETHLLNLCVAPGKQGQGIGRRLLLRAIRLAREQGADTVFLEVRTSNRAARGLYESEGFCEIGQRRGYYPHDEHEREDAAVYAKPLL